ncbi:MAG: ABC transporter [Clostridiales bacterium]|nr:MAG: ABC transporter [Clostridiales bacterium]
MIEVSNLTKHYGKKLAVKNLSFTINKGEIVGFLGPNGAGKTTVMNMLTGYISSDEGKISIGGFDMLENPLKAKLHIGYLPEIPPLYPDLTVLEYLEFVYNLKKCTLKKEEHLTEICAVTSITNVAGRRIGNLSKGYKQRVGLAQALVGDPEILIFDEPTIGLDPREIIEIRNLIRRLGTYHTVILSSHILSEIQQVCERVIIINNGELVRDECVGGLLDAATPTDRYAVRIAGPEEAVVHTIEKLDGVIKVEYVGTLEKGSVDIVVEAEKRIDVRKVLFAECAKREWFVLMLSRLGISLEDIFVNIIDTDDKKKLSAAKNADQENS